MKTIGILGGMSWVSTAEYYTYINEEVQNTLGGLNSAKIVLWSFNFKEVEALLQKEDWQALSLLLLNGAEKLKIAGAEILLIATNTMHRFADFLEEKSGLPLVHIADASAAPIAQRKLKKVALLGTRFTMQQDFYKNRLMEKFHLEVITPSPMAMEDIHNIIFNELCNNVILETSKKRYLEIIAELIANGAEAVIFACTEIGLLLNQNNVAIPVFDSCRLHAKACVAAALKN